MKKSLDNFLVIFVLIMLFSSCDTDNGIDPSAGPAVKVYLAGTHKVGEKIPGGILEGACYWVNGEKINLTETYDIIPFISEATAIAVSGDSVYVTGKYVDYYANNACYWKNGVFIDLHPEGSNYSYAAAIAIEGNTCYIGGSYAEYPIPRHACYWKEGETLSGPISLHDFEEKGEEHPSSHVEAITISDNDVYVACHYNELGISFNDSLGFWKEGDQPTPLESIGEMDSETTGITVSGDTIYVSGTYQVGIAGDIFACYWIGDKRHDLETVVNVKSSKATAIAVSGNTVYIAGYYVLQNGIRHACYWVNEKFHNLSNRDTTSSANYITFHNGSVYAAGYFTVNDDAKTYACYWKDGALYQTGIIEDCEKINSGFLVFEE